MKRYEFNLETCFNYFEKGPQKSFEENNSFSIYKNDSLNKWGVFRDFFVDKNTGISRISG